jgi:imidazolonepropionase-like amidohydrolase
LLQRSGELSCIRAGALADVLVINGDPLRNLRLFREAEASIPIVMKGGVCIRNTM